MSVPNYRYPIKNINASDDFLKITSFKYEPPRLNLGNTGSFAQRSSDDVVSEGGYGSPTGRGTVILPMPQTIQDSNGASWGAGTMDPLQTATMSAAMGVIEGKDPVTGTANAVTQLLGKLGAASQTAIGQDLTKTFFATKASEALTGNGDFNQSLSRQTGAVLNSNTELLFNGIAPPRAFSFSFDLVPRSEPESKVIKDIILFFKKESAAQKGAETGGAAGLFLKSPSVFKLQYMSGGKSHPFLHQFKICALTSMSVNYTGSGTYATYSDATPVHMQMALSFNELTPIYREDYVDNSGNNKSTLTGTGF
jgi:hypothetical protein